MTYLFLGDDSTSKDKKIIELRDKILKSKEAIKFDYDVIHAHKLSPEILKKSFVSLPAVAEQRVIVIRQCHKLSAHNKGLIEEFIKKPYSPSVLILDSDELDEDASFVRKLRQSLKITHFSKTIGQNVFDLTKFISMHKRTEALKMLSGLLDQGDHPLQIMGVLVWHWKKSRNRMSGELFKEGLLALQEADLNIKRSRLKSEFALELLVIKLCS